MIYILIIFVMDILLVLAGYQYFCNHSEYLKAGDGPVELYPDPDRYRIHLLPPSGTDA